MAVSALAFLDQAGAGPWKPVYVIGPGKAPRAKAATFEPLLAERALDAIVSKAVEPEARDMALAAFHADDTDAGTVLAEAQTMPFLTERRVVVVRNAERYMTGDSGDALLGYLAAPNDTTVLVLLMTQIDKRTKFYKACEKSAEFVECAALNAKDATQWLKGEARRLGWKIDSGAADALIGRAGVHLSDVSNALTLVTNFLGDEKTITEEAVRAACADVAEEEIWALTDAIAASDAAKALHALRALLDLGKHPDEIIGTINWLLKTAYRVEQGDAGVHRFVAEKVGPLAKRYGMAKLIRAFGLCTDTQFSMRTTGVDGDLAVEMLVMKLAYAPRRAS